MHKITIVLFLAVISFSTTSAQNMVSKRQSQINESEVPVAVRQAFLRDFDQAPKDGLWTVYFSTVRQDGKTVATPIWYTFSRNEAGVKVEVRYLPDGKLKSARGISKRQPGKDSNEAPEQEKPSTVM
jgi:hypothetical protein